MNRTNVFLFIDFYREKKIDAHSFQDYLNNGGILFIAIKERRALNQQEITGRGSGCKLEERMR